MLLFAAANQTPLALVLGAHSNILRHSVVSFACVLIPIGMYFFLPGERDVFFAVAFANLLVPFMILAAIFAVLATVAWIRQTTRKKRPRRDSFLEIAFALPAILIWTCFIGAFLIENWTSHS